MRITQALTRQHLGFMFKKHWRIQGKRTPINTGAEDGLISRGIKVVDCKEILFPTPVRINTDFVGIYSNDIKNDETHPLWQDEKCHIFRDSNVLLEGVPQAQVLLKTIELKELPSKMEEQFTKLKIPKNIHISMEQFVLSSHVLDSEQEKTAVIKLSDRIAFNLPRNYGITDNRKCRLITTKLIQQCEKLAGRTITSGRKIINDAYFAVTFKKDDDNILLEMNAETFLSSRKGITPNVENIAEEFELPNLSPVKHTVSIPTTNIYEPQNIYPINSQNEFSHPHTIWLYFSPLDVKNLHETPVSHSQFESRSVVKAFAVAASRAKQIFGPDVKTLPKPIVVQSIQTDGNLFNFGVFQLNTLDLNGSGGEKNYWYSKEKLYLFSKCAYIDGKPSLYDYNPDVLKYCFLFYNNS